MSRFLSLVLALSLATAVHAAPKRRSVSASRPYPLHSLELIADTSDLAPLRNIVGNASVVGLGDATHGTHEFFTVRLRLIDFLVREKNFDVISIEAPFPIMERLNVYAQGGPGDARALLRELNDRLLYFFWNTEEFLAMVEWVRAYNAHRGEKPPIELAGADIYDYEGGVAGVLAYLDRVDPAAAAFARADYACVLAGNRNSDCESAALRVRNGVASRNDVEAIHYADSVLHAFHLQAFGPREDAMAANLLWIREHRGTARKVIHWGHQEHVSKLNSPFTGGRTMGTIVASQLGSDYVAIGTLAGGGTFLQWKQSGSIFLESIQTFADPPAGSYEWQFRSFGYPAALVPLRGGHGSATFRTAPTTVGQVTLTQSLPQKLDAVIYVDVMTPTRPLR